MQGSEEEQRAAEGTLVAVLEATRIVAVLLAPITPALSRRIMAQLAAPEVPAPAHPSLANRRSGVGLLFGSAACTSERVQQPLKRICRFVRAPQETRRATCLEWNPASHGDRELTTSLLLLQSFRWQDAEWGGLEAGQRVSEARPVFQRLEGDFCIQKPETVASA